MFELERCWAGVCVVAQARAVGTEQRKYPGWKAARQTYPASLADLLGFKLANLLSLHNERRQRRQLLKARIALFRASDESA